MSLINTNTGRTVFKNAESLMLVPYTYNSTLGDYVLGDDIYDLSAIIGDSIVIEQQDDDTIVKNNEFVASPLVECMSGAKYGFTAQCIDLQNKVLKACFNAMTVNNVNGAAAFNDDYTLIFVMIRVRFRDDSLPDVVIPKAQLNSKLLIDQLKTRVSQGNIVGTARSMNISIGNAAGSAVLQFNVPSTNGTTYTPYTPVFFVPRNYNPLVLHHKGSGVVDTYSLPNFMTGVISTVGVNKNTGDITTAPSGGGSGDENSESQQEENES